MKTYVKKPGYHYLSETEFDTILQLFRLKQSDLFVARATKRANSLISKIRRSGAKNLEEFREYTKAMAEQREQVKQTPLPLEPETHKPTPERSIDETVYTDRVIEILDSHLNKLYPLLERIAIALEEANKPYTTNAVVEKQEENASEEDLPIL